MSIENACTAISDWIAEFESTAEGRDASAFFTGALLIALSDGPLSDGEHAELGMLYTALTGEALDDGKIEEEVGWINDNGIDGAIEGIANAVEGDEERGLLVSFAALIACAESGVNAKEGAMLQNIGQTLGFSQNDVLKFLGNAMNTAKHGTGFGYALAREPSDQETAALARACAAVFFCSW